jgi:putative ABC transport system ATP-binding protein
MGAPVVRLREVGKIYEEDGLRVAAVRNVSLVVPEGRFTTLVGPSGSGKSTLLNLIGCIDRPTSGSIEIGGRELSGMADDELADFRARSIGYVFQSFNLLRVLTAFENVEYPLLLLGGSAAQRRDRVLEVLQAVGLSAERDRRPNQLSGGQKQRVAIARALVKSPALVLADEPTANLDSRTGEGIIALMRDLQRQRGISFVFSTHDKQLMSHADVLFTVRDGELV